MKIFSYRNCDSKQILNFLNLCHVSIGDKLNFEQKDSDLLSLENEYCKKGGEFWCMFDNNNNILGTIAVRCLNIDNIMFAELRRFYVISNEQNKGYGQILLNVAMDFCKEKGYTCIRATTTQNKFKIIHLLYKYKFYQIEKYRTSHADLFFEFRTNYYLKTFSEKLQSSLNALVDYNHSTLILNPVENVPKHEILEPCSSNIHGLYNTDSIRSTGQKINSKIQFSGRSIITNNVNEIYTEWAKLLKGQAVSMRLLSGLHAHIVLFMGISNIGDKVLLMPENGGGHMSTKLILERLGLIVEEFIINETTLSIDIDKSLKLIQQFQPKFIFIDRSEGLYYEDFSWLKDISSYKIFDASQYLTNILCETYVNPFDWGFDMILSTLHKNIPGPQRALLCVKEFNSQWIELKSKISTYVSNMHFFSIYSAGLLLSEFDALCALSNNMLENTLKLEKNLLSHNVPVIDRSKISNRIPTHHIWVSAPTKEIAYNWYLRLESIGILVNYRKLPYNLGYGLRLGLSAATYSGLKPQNIEQLSHLIKKAIDDDIDDTIYFESKQFIDVIKGQSHEK